MVGRAPKRPSLTYRCSETKAEAEGELFYQHFPSFFLPPASASLLRESHPTPNIEHLPSLMPTSTERLPRELLRTCSLSPSTLNRSRASSVKLISQYRLAFGYSLYDAQLQEITPALICSDACALLALNYLSLVFI